FERTVCACAECKVFCSTIPSFLIPSDLHRIAEYLGCDDPVELALKYLLASPGATVLDRGRLRQIRTLVPARRQDGACVFLDENERCSIHAVSGFGCSYFDAHQSAKEANRRSSCGLRRIDRAWYANELYAQLWMLLYTLGRVAPSPIAARALAEEALERLRASSLSPAETAAHNIFPPHPKTPQFSFFNIACPVPQPNPRSRPTADSFLKNRYASPTYQLRTSRIVGHPSRLNAFIALHNGRLHFFWCRPSI